MGGRAREMALAGGLGALARAGADPGAWGEAFAWAEGETPASSPWVAVCAAGVYVALVLAGRASSWCRAPALARAVAPLHNLILCGGSALMFAGCASASYRRSMEEGSAAWMLCTPSSDRVVGSLYFWSYVYYLSKYYELIDTVLMVLNDKPLSTLHVWHHSTVIIMSWLWLQYAQSLQQIALLTNTGVHVIMYAYYGLTSLGYKPRWKVLVTNVQIVQFVFSFAVSVPLLRMHFGGAGPCQGFNAWGFNAGFNASLLYLFWDFHRRVYRSKKAKRG